MTLNFKPKIKETILGFFSPSSYRDFFRISLEKLRSFDVSLFFPPTLELCQRRPHLPHNTTHHWAHLPHIIKPQPIKSHEVGGTQTKGTSLRHAGSIFKVFVDPLPETSARTCRAENILTPYFI